MAKFLFTSDGHFVNLEMITAMRIKGQIGNLQRIEIWFSGNTADHPGLSLYDKGANELFDELLRLHKMLGWTSADSDAAKNEPEET